MAYMRVVYVAVTVCIVGASMLERSTFADVRIGGAGSVNRSYPEISSLLTGLCLNHKKIGFNYFNCIKFAYDPCDEKEQLTPYNGVFERALFKFENPHEKFSTMVSWMLKTAPRDCLQSMKNDAVIEYEKLVSEKKNQKKMAKKTIRMNEVRAYYAQAEKQALARPRGSVFSEIPQVSQETKDKIIKLQEAENKELAAIQIEKTSLRWRPIRDALLRDKRLGDISAYELVLDDFHDFLRTLRDVALVVHSKPMDFGFFFYPLPSGFRGSIKSGFFKSELALKCETETKKYNVAEYYDDVWELMDPGDLINPDLAAYEWMAISNEQFTDSDWRAGVDQWVVRLINRARPIFSEGGLEKGCELLEATAISISQEEEKKEAISP